MLVWVLRNVVGVIVVVLLVLVFSYSYGVIIFEVFLSSYVVVDFCVVFVVSCKKVFFIFLFVIVF